MPGLPAGPGLTRRTAAYHRAACASTSSPGPRNRSASTSCGRSPRGSSGSGSPGSAGARPGSTAPARLGSYRDVRAFRDDPGREAVGRTETTSALVHLRRPSRLSTLTLPDTQPFDDPDGRFAFSHNGDLRDYTGLRATYRAQGRIHGRADTEVGARWLEDAWRPGRTGGAPARGAPRPVRRAGEPRGPRPRRRRPPLRRQRREPGLLVPARARSASSRPASTRSIGRCSGSRRPGATERRLVPLHTTAEPRPRREALARRIGWPAAGAS